MANVFVSYRKPDYADASRLAREIRKSGHQVWLDEWNINLGDSIIASMNQGLTAADYVVVCYSSSGTTSPWMSREWMSALARQLEGHKIKLLPVVLTGGQPPAILADIVYVDLVKDWSAGIGKLLDAIK
jgi:hypothetical protein